MHELACPGCGTPSQYDLRDHLIMCPFCSVTFNLDAESGHKEIFGDHYIVPNTADPRKVKDLVMEWLRRLHHNPNIAEKEYFVTDIRGVSIPFWVISLEGHTVWKGLAQRNKRILEAAPGADFLLENGQFRRSYRWAINARSNICETWGAARLHEPKEPIQVEWDGFPLDSTFSRGRLQDMENEKSAYDSREFFEFKYSNGLAVQGVQVSEEEALRRARTQVELYHFKLASLNVDYLTDHRTELEIAGIQLIHLPFWHARYVYQPRTALKHLYKPKDKHVLLDGNSTGVLKGELALVHRDKVWVNALITGVASVLMFLLGAAWHPAFFLIALFCLVVSGMSGYIATTRSGKRADYTLKVNSQGVVSDEGKAAKAVA